jgi:hypothetical protein
VSLPFALPEAKEIVAKNLNLLGHRLNQCGQSQQPNLISHKGTKDTKVFHDKPFPFVAFVPSCEKQLVCIVFVGS